MSSAFSHLSRSVTRSGSSVTRGLFSAWSSSRHDGQPHHGIVQSMSCWWILIQLFIELWTSQKFREVHSLPQVPHTLEQEERPRGRFWLFYVDYELPGVLGEQEPFLSLSLDEAENFLWLCHNFFLDTRNVICLFPLVPICYAERK